MRKEQCILISSAWIRAAVVPSVTTACFIESNVFSLSLSLCLSLSLSKLRDIRRVQSDMRAEQSQS